MKKLILFAAALILAASCNSGTNYTIKGDIAGESTYLKNGKAFLFNRDRNFPVRDTVEIVDGKFKFTGSIDTPEFFMVVIDGIPGMVHLFLENDTYTITGADSTFSDSKVEGGKTHALLTKVNDEMNAVGEKYDIMRLTMTLRSAALPELERDSLIRIYETYVEECQAIKDAYVAENPVSYLSLYFLKDEFSDMPVEESQPLLQKFQADKRFANNRIVAALDEQLQKELKLQVGMQSLDFTMNDPDGNPITFSDIYRENKVTMIDFWASWCSPCRKFNPTLVDIYKKFHKKGFEVIGVSLDRDQAPWEQAIEKDGLTWPQVSDLQYWDNAVSTMYNVRYIPQNVFVDSNGVIIGRQVAEEDIVPLLEKYLN